MIVAETADGYQFVTQPDHAALAGRFAERWGGDVDRPEPGTSLVIAAHAHDTGWAAFDRHPHLDDDGAPVDFRDMPADTWTDLYDDGIDAVVEMDAYAGLLVSMHGAGLRKRRYGLSPEWPETPDAFEGFVDREERRQRNLLDALLDGDEGTGDPGGPPAPEELPVSDDVPVSDADRRLLSALHESRRVPDDYDGRLWADYRRLQTWDALSLAFCITDSPPGYGELDSVPTADTTLSLTRTGDGEFAVDPYPFDSSPLTATVPTRTVARDAFDGETSLVRAYYAAGRERSLLTLRPADR